MKYLENTKLEALGSALSVVDADVKIQSRVESYSCKMVQSDKRAYRDFLGDSGLSPNGREPLSPQADDQCWQFGQSPSLQPPRMRHRSRSTSGSDLDEGAVMCESITAKTLFQLIALLNASYSDYDFTDARGDDFRRISANDTNVRAVINAHLSAHIAERTLNRAWQLIDGEIHAKECAIYSYKPDYSSDPFSEAGNIWQLNYFFYNKRLKRILFVACKAFNPSSLAVGSSDDSSQDSVMWTCDED